MNWGVPDWRDASAYPKPDGLTNREWRWQFTRRRPDYRELWTIWGAVQRDHVMANEAEYAELAGRQGDTIEIFLDSAPTDHPDLLRLQYRMSVVLNPTKDFDDWRLMGPDCPVDGETFEVAPPNPEDLPERWRDERIAHDRAHRQHLSRLREEHGAVTYLFDLSRPLGPQLAKARRNLAESQEMRFGKLNTRKPRKSNWPLFLRALDAKDAQATYREMSEVFWPESEAQDEGSARDIYQAAVQVRDNFPL